jgi:hypothetical protein
MPTTVRPILLALRTFRRLALMKTLTTEKREDRRRGEKKGFTTGNVSRKKDVQAQQLDGN